MTPFTVVVIVSKSGEKQISDSRSDCAGDQRNHCVYETQLPCTRVLERMFGPWVTAVILKMLHPYKHPGLTVMSSEYIKCSLTNYPPYLLAEKGKVENLSGQASKVLYSPRVNI